MRSLNANLKAAIRYFSLYTKNNNITNNSKIKIALSLLQEQASHYIYKDSSEKDPFSSLDMNIFKTSKEKVLVFLTDSYKVIFDDIFKINELFYKFTKKITHKLGIEYRQDINNWRNESIYNPNWRTLVPVLDYLKGKNITFVHRLIGLYLRKNAQKHLRTFLMFPKVN
jgi:hypothetical protein